MSVRFEVLPAASWAETIAADLAERLAAQPRLRVCLPTGETPAPVYAALARLAERGEVSFAEATVVLLDEYVGLPPGDPARGGDRLRRELLDRLDPPPAAVHLINADDPDVEWVAAAHDAIAAEGIDLALLGLGLNGHIGLNEPGSEPDSPTRLVRIARSSREVAVERYGASLPPTAGVTLGVARLLEAGEIWLLVTGERKRSILRRVLLDAEGPDAPASFLLRHPRLRIVADDEAAADLPPIRPA